MKIFKIIFWLFLLGVGAVSASVFWLYLFFNAAEPVSKYEPDEIIETEQCSMSEYGFYDGHSYPLYHKSKYLVNDVISFTCHSDKCNDGLIKRIDKIKEVNGEKCYYLMGNSNPYKCPMINPSQPDMLYHSFDSREFGWLCGDEIDIEGVVVR